jgi:heptosyltransferase-2
MSQPLLARLAGAGEKIDVLAPAWVAPVYARMSCVREVIESPFKHGDLAIARRFSLARKMAPRAYQRAVILPNSLKSALLPFFAGIPERVGFLGESRYGLVNCRHILDKRALPLMVERFAQLAQPVGSPLRHPVLSPRLDSSVPQQASTLKALGLARPASGKLAIFCPGAEFGPAKRWPSGHFARLAKALIARGFTIWLAGSPKDQEVGDAIRAEEPAVVNLCGRSSMTQAIDLLALADIVVSNDSGLMHVAAALDRPLVSLFGSSSPEFTPPLSEHAKVLRTGIDCSPCFKRTCPLGHLDCLNGLLPETVLSNIDTLLEISPR